MGRTFLAEMGQAAIETFGKFELLECLGESPSARVYKARQAGDGALVALKINKTPMSYAQARLGRYGGEMKIAASLEHPGICHILGSGKEADYAYVVMELLEGETLLHRITHRGPLAPAEAVAIAVQVTEALAYAHQQNVVHRDVKPDNIMLLPDGAAKVLDFGIARRGASAEGSQVVGTPAYMSPEQAQGRAVDDLSDVYATGAVLYHALSGRPPYVGQDVQALLTVVASGRHVPLERAAPGVPKKLARVVEKAMSPVARRYTSATALLNDLRGLGEVSGAPATPRAPAASNDLSVAFIGLAVVAALLALGAVWWAGVFK